MQVVFIHTCEWYVIICVSCIYSLLLSGIYQYTPPVNDILSSVRVVFTDSSEWYLPVYTPCKWYFIIFVSCIYSLLWVVFTSIHPLWMIFYHLSELYLLTPLEWYLPVYTPVNDILSSLWVVFTHSFEWYLPIYTPCKWYFPPTVNGIYSSLSGIYTLLWVIFPLTVSGIYSHLWVVFTHCECFYSHLWVVFIYTPLSVIFSPCKWHL